jgi:hypothetical protein
MLPPLKTMDALFSVPAQAEAQTFALYDRRLGLVNSTSMGMGGMLTHLDVSTPPCPTDVTESWLTEHFGPAGLGGYPLNTVGPQDDPDGDTVSNLNEFISGTDPNNDASYLRITALSPPDPMTGALITFGDTAAGRLYNLESSTNLLAGSWDTVRTNVAGFAGAMWLNDPRPLVPTRFYRIKLACP